MTQDELADILVDILDNARTELTIAETLGAVDQVKNALLLQAAVERLREEQP